MKNNEIKWGSIPIIGLEDDNLFVYPLKHLNAIDNGKLAFYNKTEQQIDEINLKKSKSHIGLKQSEETKIKKSKSLKGKSKSNEHIKNISLSKIGKLHNQKTKIKISNATKGENNPMYGVNHSIESKKKISKNHGAKTLIKCPHCGKDFPSNNYKRYHGDNCKLKDIS